MDKATFARLYKEGKEVRAGDRESGIWVCPETGYYQIGKERYVYIREGSRLKATWEFRGSDWKLSAVDTDAILPPKAPETHISKLRVWKWRLVFAGLAAVAALLLVCGGGA